MNKKRLEIIVGAFVLLGIAIFCFFVFFIGGMHMLKSGYRLNVHFGFVSGISKGATIRYAGVPVGEVVSLRTEYGENGKPHVVVTIWLEEGTIVREGTKIEIRGAFALSEAHIEIISAGNNEGKILGDGDMLQGIDPVSLDNLIREGEDITALLKNILINIDNFVADDGMKATVKNTLVNFDVLTTKLNDILYSSEDDIKDIIANAEKSINELHEAIIKANGVVDSLENKEGTVGKLLYDDALYNELMAFIQDIKIHPWKLLKKTKSQEEEQPKKKGFFGRG